MRRGVAPTALLLDGNTFLSENAGVSKSSSSAYDMEAMTGLLADHGVPSHRIARGTPFRPVEVHERIGRPEYKVLSGTGRVIMVER
jgi:hypothetical protein